MSDGPTIRRGKSRQDYKTPHDFISAVKIRFGDLSMDLAASLENAQAEQFLSEEDDSLSFCWSDFDFDEIMWLNPPFDNIRPWAEKCHTESLLGAKILFLTPASVGSNWFAEHVNRHAMVLALNGRLCFDGANPYPKDCILSCYGFVVGFDVWKWK